MRKKKKVPWREVFPKYENSGAFQMLEDVLKFDPRARLSVEQALSHPYLESLHHPDDEPTCDEPFEFHFDDNTELKKRRLQELMYAQSLHFHP